MIDKLDFLFRFWELKARHAQMGLPLSQDEQQELLSLMQLVVADLRIPEPGPAPRNRDALPAQLIGAQSISPVEVRALTASTLVVSCTRRTDGCAVAGKPVVLRATCALGGVEYTIPCQVAWVHSGAARRSGVRSAACRWHSDARAFCRRGAGNDGGCTATAGAVRLRPLMAEGACAAGSWSTVAHALR